MPSAGAVPEPGRAVTGSSPPGQDKKAVLCRQDWHQTGSQVVVTVYAKNPLPALSSVKANRTVVSGVGSARSWPTWVCSPRSQLGAWCCLLALPTCHP